jgi:hypothetical protein
MVFQNLNPYSLSDTEGAAFDVARNVFGIATPRLQRVARTLDCWLVQAQF